jgi:hypothetical protein
MKVLSDPDVREELIKVIEFIFQEKESEEVLAKYLNTVFLRSDVLGHLTDLFK